MAVKNRADSGFRKFQVRCKLCLSGQYVAPKCPTFIAEPLVAIPPIPRPKLKGRMYQFLF